MGRTARKPKKEIRYAAWLAARIAEAEAKGYDCSARKIALYVDVSNNTISGHLRGIRPHAETVMATARYLQANIDEALEAAGYEVGAPDYPYSVKMERFLEKLHRLPIEEQNAAIDAADLQLDLYLKWRAGKPGGGPHTDPVDSPGAV